MKAQTRYLEQLESLIHKLKTHDDSIEAAAAVVARALENDGLMHVFGTGHSHMLGKSRPPQLK